MSDFRIAALGYWVGFALVAFVSMIFGEPPGGHLAYIYAPLFVAVTAVIASGKRDA